MQNKKTISVIVLWVLFIVVSLLYINTPLRQARSEYRSSSLKQVTVKSDNRERTDYVDETGTITIAANVGYATKIVTKTDNTELEEYFDAEGLPITRYSNYYALLREYNDKGKNFRVTYLDKDKNPVVMADGYAIEERVFDEKGRIVQTYYFDAGGNPVRTPSYGCCKINEFNEDGKVSRITYVDESGVPVVTRSGYASIARNYYKTDDQNDGKVESEFYFDAQGEPISLSLGQFGVHKEYDENGQTALITYLDAEGEPMAANKGYTTVTRTFHANNTIATERYFDQNSQPYALAEWQYGISIENGLTTYLNAQGQEWFNIKNLLYNQSWLVVPAALLLVFLSSVLNKKVNSLLLILYVGVIGYFTLMYRESGERQWDLRTFERLISLFTSGEARSDILKNIWLFIPLGAILYRLHGRMYMLFVPVVLSAVIEAVQFFTGTGMCELTDVVSNGLGGAIGFGMSAFLTSLKERYLNKAK